MSVQAISWVFDNSKFGGSNLVVLLAIANHAHADGTGSYPSIQTLAKEARISARHVTRVVRILEEAGELVVHWGGGGRRANEYAVPMGVNNLNIIETLRDALKSTETNRPDKMSGLEKASDPTSCPPRPDTSVTPALTPTSRAYKEGTVIEPSEEKNGASPPLLTPAEQVFTEWQKALGHPRARFGKEDRATINNRLKEGYTVEQLCRVPHGVLRDPFYLGQNERQRKYDSIGVIFKNSGKVVYFLELDEGAPAANGNGETHARMECDLCDEDGFIEEVNEATGKKRISRCVHGQRRVNEQETVH